MNYQNAELGISLSLPEGWIVASQLDAEAFRKRMAEDPDKSVGEFLGAEQLPMIALMKHGDDYADVNPSVQLSARDVSGLADRTPEALARATFLMIEQFPDSKLEGMETREIDGSPAALATMSYTVANHIAEFHIKSRLLVIRRDSLVFQLGLAGNQFGEDACEEEFSAVLDSVRLLA
jgi:hypothetical protein